MKNLDLNKFGVQEMNAGEMEKVDGGSWLSDAVGAVGEAIGNAWNWLVGHSTGSGIAIEI